MLKKISLYCVVTLWVSPLLCMELEQSRSDMAQTLRSLQHSGLVELIEKDSQKILRKELKRQEPSQDRFHEKLADLPWISYLDKHNGYSNEEREQVLGETILSVLCDFEKQTQADEKPCMSYNDLITRYNTKTKNVPPVLAQAIKGNQLYKLGLNFCTHISQSKYNEIVPQIRNFLASGPTIGLCSWLLAQHHDITYTHMKKTQLTSVGKKVEDLTEKSFTLTQKSLNGLIQQEAPVHYGNITELLDDEFTTQKNKCCKQIIDTLKGAIKKYDSDLQEITQDMLDTHDSDKQINALKKLFANQIKLLPEPADLEKNGISPENVKRQLTTSIQKLVQQGNELFSNYVKKDDPLFNKNSEYYNPTTKSVTVDIRNKDDVRKMRVAQKNNDLKILFDTTLIQTIGAALEKINQFNCSKMENNRYFPQPLNDMFWAYKIIGHMQGKCDPLLERYNTKKESSEDCIRELEKIEKPIPTFLKNIENNHYQNLTKMIYGGILSECIHELKKN